MICRAKMDEQGNINIIVNILVTRHLVQLEY